MKPFLRLAALFVASVFLIACNPATDSSGAGIKLAVHFRDVRLGTHMVPAGKDTQQHLNAAAEIDAALRAALSRHGYQLVGNDKNADAVVTYVLKNFSAEQRSADFVRHITLYMDLATRVQVKGHTFHQENLFQTEHKGIDFPLWDTSKAQKRHAIGDMIDKVDETSQLKSFLAGVKS